MSNDRVEVSETGPPTQNASWGQHGESLSPEFEVPPPEPPPAEPAAPEPMPPKKRRWRFVPRSLSSRLVAFVVGLVVVVVAASGSATYVALKSFLYERLDQQLRETVSQDPRSIVASNTQPNGTAYHGPQQVWLVLLAPNGDVVATPDPHSDVPTLDLSPTQRSDVAANVAPTRSLTTLSGDHLRVAARETYYAGTPVVEVAGLSTSEIDRTLHRLVLLEVAIGALAVAAALAVTSWGVHLSLRPLNRVTRTAREVTAELSPDGAGLDRRVPEGDPQTEVGQLADSFNSLMGTVETQFAARVESEQRMRQFLADASHELRTPLTSIRGYAELARMSRANGEPEQADTLERIESEGTRMSRLVDDLLLLARSDRGASPQRELVEVSELIEDAVDGARAAFPQRRIDVAAPPDLHLVGDHDQLLRVLRNLVTNAAVHTDPNGPIRVTAHAEAADVVIRVIDSGPGLTPEQAQHVFERFWRADKARTRARGGSGLGLAIVASIVGAHHGTVDFKSTVTGGSTVTLRLPADGLVDDPAEGESASQPPDRSGWAPPSP